MVTPTRIVFEGNDRTKQVNLVNNGSETGRFRISFVRRNMTADRSSKHVKSLGHIASTACERYGSC